MKQTFFIQIPLGLENLAIHELRLKWPVVFPNKTCPEVFAEDGGFNVELLFEEACLLNHWLKIPNKILMRIASFKCRDFPKLFKKISAIDWKPFLGSQEFEYHISSTDSRLFDDRKIKNAIKGGIERYIQKSPIKKKFIEKTQEYPHWNLYMRIENDWCQLSLDISGERLGIRGYRKFVGKAPLRENLASACYYALTFDLEHGTEYNLIDPICGSGTLLSEALLFLRPNDFRQYAYQYLPCYESNLKPIDHQFEKHYEIYGFDKDKNQLEQFQNNLDELEQQGHDLDIINSEVSDLYDKEIPKLKYDQNICIANLPYNKRIKNTEGNKKLICAIRDKFSPLKIGVIIPQTKTPPTIEGYEVSENLAFINGGFKVSFVIYRKPSS